MITPEPINARFVGGPLDGETHVMAHRLPYVQVPGPDETFFARLWIERPEDCPEERLYQVESADDAETLVYRCLADWPDAPVPPGAQVAESSAGPAPDGPA
ncbi:hypothetical protein [Patulibacter minatonensis]|uniref:hypothetical protein n=1 Tax=Patulibacter minatonensis TaxID=298163 RepID=UPI00047EA0FE|nr:hypothetical protein [Patulibacter minatonensis]